MELPIGVCARILPRSGLGTKHEIEAFHGLIDSDYRGEMVVSLKNWSDAPKTFCYGDRIAQMIIHKIEIPIFEFVDELNITTRGIGGFGSTGL